MLAELNPKTIDLFFLNENLFLSILVIKKSVDSK